VARRLLQTPAADVEAQMRERGSERTTRSSQFSAHDSQRQSTAAGEVAGREETRCTAPETGAGVRSQDTRQGGQTGASNSLSELVSKYAVPKG